MSFSHQQEAQIISKKLLNTQIEQSFFKFKRELGCESQYPFYTHQLHSYLSPYLSTLNTNRSKILFESSFQNLDEIIKEYAEIDEMKMSFTRREYKLKRSLLKRKRNFYLKSLVQYPKSALNLLKEVYPQLNIKVRKELYGTQVSYTSEINIDGYEFRATDFTEEKANERACEEVIKTIFFGKVFDVPFNIADEDIEMKESNALSESSDMKTQEENQSWSLLARYAIFKLFSEWSKSNVKEEFLTPKLSKVPSVPDIIYKKHPVQLLHEIRPTWRFIEERDGFSSKCAFKASILTDDQIFTGTGRNKKLARKDCAENVLKALGINYLWG